MMMEVLTHSKRSLFKACPRAYYYKHELRLVPRLLKATKRRGTAFGKGIHAGLASENPFGAAEEEINAYYEDAAPNSQEEQNELEVEMTAVQALARRYLAIYGQDGRREVEYRRPLINPKTGRSSRTFELGGKIDGLVVLGDRHARLIEDKLTVQIGLARIDALPLDEQTTEYIDALMWKGWTGEVEYRFTRWPSIKQRQKETLGQFLDRLLEDIDEREPFYFLHQKVLFPTGHMAEHRQERWDVAKAIMGCRRRGRWWKNPARCDLFGGGCQYPALCQGRPDGMDLYVVSEDNPELERSDA